MSGKLIYLDTNLWNRLLDQNVVATDLFTQLKTRDRHIALSQQTTYELQKTFRNDRQRGQDLFRYLQQCLDAGVVAVVDVMEQLHRESDALSTQLPAIDPLYAPLDLATLTAQVVKLATGTFDEEDEAFLTTRKQFAQAARDGPRGHFETKVDVQDRLKAVPEVELAAWLDREVQSARGAALLMRHLLRMYTDGLSADTAAVLAQVLLSNQRFRAGRALVRADLYTNWRFAHRDSLRSDLVDDMYHVLNANYCDIYATAEASQENYAKLLLSPATHVAIYDDRTPIAAWLTALN